MSEEKRDYPEWLDQELFSGLDGAPAEKKDGGKGKEEASPEEPVKKKKKAMSDEEPVKKKKKAASLEKATSDEAPVKKKKKAASDEEPVKKKKKVSTGEEPAKKKKTASDEAPVKKKKAAALEKAAASEKTAASENTAVDEKAESNRKQAKRKKAGKAAKRGLIGLIVLASLALIVCAGAAVGGYLITNSPNNLPNVYIGEIYVGGMTREDTIKALEEGKWEETNGGTLHVTLPQDVSFDVDYLEAGLVLRNEDAAEQAFRYGHGDDWFENLFTYISDLLAPKDLGHAELTPDDGYIASRVNEAADRFDEITAGESYTVDQEKSKLVVVKGAGQVALDRSAIASRVREAMVNGEKELVWDQVLTDAVTSPDFNAIAEEYSRESANAYYDPEKDEIIPEVMGVEIDAEAARKAWESSDIMETVEIPIKLIEPEITAESLREVLFHDKLGDCLTYLWGSTANRISNIRLACSRFDGMVLQPGEQFSYNDVVGERTAEAGFLPAPTYNGTAHEMGLGGGICQVSSTLYNAVLYANLQIDERVCHTMVVGYLPLGLDATVDWPSTNFAFTNNRDYPIRLKAGVDESGRSLTIEVWGTDVDGSHVDMLHYEWPAYDETYREKYGLEVKVGYGARSVRRVYDADGNYTDEPDVFSYYHIPDDEINWPAVPVEEEEEAADTEG